MTFFGSFFLLFFVIVSCCRRFEDVEKLVKVLVLGSCVVAFFGIVQSRTGFNIFGPSVASAWRATTLDGRLYGDLARRSHPSLCFGAASNRARRGARACHPARRCRRRVLASAHLVGSANSATAGCGRVSLTYGNAHVRDHRRGVLVGFAHAGETLLATAPSRPRRHPHRGARNDRRVTSFFPKGGLVAQQTNAAVGSGRLATLGPALHREFRPNPLVGEGFATRIVDPLDGTPNAPILDDRWAGVVCETGLLGRLAPCSGSSSASSGERAPPAGARPIPARLVACRARRIGSELHDRNRDLRRILVHPGHDPVLRLPRARQRAPPRRPACAS